MTVFPDQLTLDEAPFPDYRADSIDTSVETAIENRPRRPRHREMVLAALKAAGPAGLTDFELAEAVDLQQTSCGCRRNDLVKAGLVQKVEGVRRPSPSGSPAQVWVAK